jgi:rod shape-determining protein MreC
VAVLVLAALTFVTIDARSSGKGVTSDLRSGFHDVFSPLQSATHDVLQPIGNFLTGAADYGSLRKENQRLRDQLAALQTQALQAAAEQADAQQVLQEQHLSFVGSIPTITVQVIDNGSSNFENSVTVDKGTTSGIAAGEPVVAAGGLVGTVAEATKKTATIILLTDPTFAVGVRLGPINTGTAQGVGRDQPLRVTVDTTNVAAPKLNKGQPIYTSGLAGEKYPKDIPVGRVTTFGWPPGATEPTITITPFVNVSQLAYLQVLVWSPEGTG